jgi:hypothetical protein
MSVTYPRIKTGPFSSEGISYLIWYRGIYETVLSSGLQNPDVILAVNLEQVWLHGNCDTVEIMEYIYTNRLYVQAGKEPLNRLLYKLENYVETIVSTACQLEFIPQVQGLYVLEARPVARDFLGISFGRY